jgi:hypothetical protein
MASGDYASDTEAKLSKPPQPEAATPDPMFYQLAAQAQNDKITALTTEATADSASLMARYGTRLALAGSTTGSPLVTSPSTGRVMA